MVSTPQTGEETYKKLLGTSLVPVIEEVQGCQVCSQSAVGLQGCVLGRLYAVRNNNHSSCMLYGTGKIKICHQQ